jgi:hypothetical protein
MTIETITPGSRTEWLAARQPNIGASEVAALFGEHPFLTEFELFRQKSGGGRAPMVETRVTENSSGGGKPALSPPANLAERMDALVHPARVAQAEIIEAAIADERLAESGPAGDVALADGEGGEDDA